MKKMPMGRAGGGVVGPNLIKLHASVARPSLDPLIIWCDGDQVLCPVCNTTPPTSSYTNV